MADLLRQSRQSLILATTCLVLVILGYIDLISGPEPPTQLALVIQFSIDFLEWLIISVVLMSFIEHQVHSQLMHRRNFLSKRKKSFQRIFEAHALDHHHHYSKEFCDEPVSPGTDKEIRLTVRKAPIKALPVAILMALVSLPGAIIFLSIVTLHHWLWNKIHLEMHKPQGKFFSTWPAYKFLARHHYLHHRYQDKNFNVVFPFADYVLGTNANATEADFVQMKRLGFA